MPGRSFTAGTGYRYGFNGKENDNEVKGNGNQQDYGMRVYDPRFARFLSVDPIASQFPFYSSYAFAGNKPIWKVDLDGLEEGDYFAAERSFEQLTSNKSEKEISEIKRNAALLYGGIAVGMLTLVAAPGYIAASGESGWTILSALMGDESAAYGYYGATGVVGATGSYVASESKQIVSSETEISNAVKSNCSFNPVASEIKVTSIGRTKTGKIRVNAQQGDKRLDITEERVKEYLPEPRNPGTGERQVNFKKEGTPEGSNVFQNDPKKRTPTPEELKIIEKHSPPSKTTTSDPNKK